MTAELAYNLFQTMELPIGERKRLIKMMESDMTVRRVSSREKRRALFKAKFKAKLEASSRDYQKKQISC